MPKKKKTKQEKQPEAPQVNKPQQVNLQANNQFCSVLHATFFTPNQCDAITEKCVDELWMSGETIGGGVAIMPLFTPSQITLFWRMQPFATSTLSKMTQLFILHLLPIFTPLPTVLFLMAPPLPFSTFSPRSELSLACTVPDSLLKIPSNGAPVPLMA